MRARPGGGDTRAGPASALGAATPPTVLSTGGSSAREARRLGHAGHKQAVSDDSGMARVARLTRARPNPG
jgi:hypothetical protein